MSKTWKIIWTAVCFLSSFGMLLIAFYTIDIYEWWADAVGIATFGFAIVLLFKALWLWFQD